LDAFAGWTVLPLHEPRRQAFWAKEGREVEGCLSPANWPLLA
jgi:hypothetical protein